MLCPQSHEDRAWLLAEVDRLRAENAKLRDYLLGDARCPCCQQVDVCLPDCTFVTDAPDAAERMDEVRAVLKDAQP